MMTRVLIDTDILSYFLKGHTSVVDHVKMYLEEYDFLETSIITYYEIQSGLIAKNATTQLIRFNRLMEHVLVLPLTEESALISSNIYAELKKQGKLVDDIDLLIAGIAIENNMTLVTNNESHFGRISSLNVANWAK